MSIALNQHHYFISTLKLVGYHIVLSQLSRYHIDHEGRVEAAISKSIPMSLGPLEAEAKALEDSIFFAWDVGVRDVIFECDSQIVC